MTVSPIGPTDGDRPSAAASAVPNTLGDRFLSPALPPTLFALPNLNAAAQEGSISPATPHSADTPTAPSVGENSTAPRRPADVAESQSPQQGAQPAATPQDAPAGRGWIEKIGAHTLVLLMLVIVVAAALVTGEKPDKTPELESVAVDFGEEATTIELGETDAPIASAELPIPPHPSSADLDSPAASGNEAASASEPGSELDFDSHSSIAASPVSTRNYSEVAISATDSGPLASEPALAAPPSDSWLADTIEEITPSDNAPRGPRLTKTPAGISDWIQYLPSMTAPTSQ